MSFSDTVFIFRHSYSCADFNGKPLQVPSLNDYCGKHCALITSVDKPSRVRQLKPYPTVPHPTPTHTTPPHPILPLPYPIPLPYNTLPHLYPTIPYPINMASLPFEIMEIMESYGFIQFEQQTLLGYFYL